MNSNFELGELEHGALWLTGVEPKLYLDSVGMIRRLKD